MGVKHFYLWYRSRFQHCILKKPDKGIDNFAIDMNGLFHLCAQKVYQYGNEVCRKIEELRCQVKPRKRLVLCVDGIAGLAKMNQQRQRRFRAAQDMDANSPLFNSNSITPGTEFMDILTRYIHRFIKTMMENSVEWQNLEVVYSNEKVSGEGEHKIMKYIRHQNKPGETWCVYGLDADLIMLGILLPIDHVYIFREMEYGGYHFMDIHNFKKELLRILKWGGSSEEDPEIRHAIIKPKKAIFSAKSAINDFVLLCFIVGNDFLPTIPSMAILDGAIDMILDSYKENGMTYGHLTKIHPRTKFITFRMDSLRKFLSMLSDHEIPTLERKYNGTIDFFPDPLVEKNLHQENANQQRRLNFENYRRDYYKKKFGFETEDEIKNLVHTYLRGMTWVINYYTMEIPDWLWYYPRLYAPFLKDIVKYMDSFKLQEFDKHAPVDPFLQLLMVLPPKSHELLPMEFHRLMLSSDSPLKHNFPETFELDMAGKKKEWESIVVLPLVNVEDFQHEYVICKNRITDERQRKRNILGKSFTYMYNNESRIVDIRSLKCI
jgi:5'-3' exonuclease